MVVGIGGGGYMGIALEQLAAPVQAAATTSTAGGTLPTASQYRYMVTAINANGETLPSNEQTVTTGAGGTNSNTVNWATVTGATGFKIYRTAAAGGTGTELLLTTVGLVTTFVDTGALVPAGALPTSNTAATPNTYAPPTKFFPFLSESLGYKQDTQWRRPIRQNVDNLGGVPGNVNTEGDIEMEALMDAAIYFHAVSRCSIVKTGPASSIYTYVCTPNPAATAVRTMSITIIRDGVVFGYTGCVVGTFKYSIDNGQLKATYSIVGSDETVQTLPTATYTNQLQPFGAGEYDIEIPTTTQVFDADGFEVTVEDNAAAQFRLKNTGRGAQFIQFGERNVTVTTERDFQNRTEYDAYKALTAQAIMLKAVKAAGEVFQFDMPAAIKDSYDISLGGQGDLIRASISYMGVFDITTQRSYQLTLKTLESVIV
jgi:hypothetical protein